MNKPKQLPFTYDKKMANKVADCKKAFAKWELDKQKKFRVTPAKNLLNKLSNFDKIVLVTVAIYLVWVLVALFQLEQLRDIEYMDSPIENTNTTNVTKLA